MKNILFLIVIIFFSSCEKKDFNWDLPRSNPFDNPNNSNSQNSFTVTTSSTPQSAGITTGGGTYNSGQTVTIAASPNSGWSFANWTDNSTIISTNKNYNFTVTSNKNYVANFDPIGPVKFTQYFLVCDEGDGDGIIEKGETVYLKVHLKNIGSIATSGGVSASFSSISPYISSLMPTTSSSSYSTINAGQETFGTYLYISSFVCNVSNAAISMSFSTLNTTPSGTQITFNIQIKDAQNNQWTDSFNLTIN